MVEQKVSVKKRHYKAVVGTPCCKEGSDVERQCILLAKALASTSMKAAGQGGT